jgi:hypothetical protein
MQRDPLEFRAGLTFYEYVRCAPLKENDPSGLFPLIILPPNLGFIRPCEAGKDITREEMDRLMNAQGNPNVGKQLDLGCVGFCLLEQPRVRYTPQPHTRPEDSARTTCYLHEADAECKKCPDGSPPFVFQVRGDWRHGEPTPNKTDKTVPRSSINTDSGAPAAWDYVTVIHLPNGKKCYVNGNGGVTYVPGGRTGQRFPASLEPRKDDPTTYPHSIWCATCP